MDSIQIVIEANETQQEILISQLSDLGAKGFEQTEENLLAYFDENNFNSYEIQEVIKPTKYHLHNIPDQNWNSLWESNFEPIRVGGFCAVRAAFHEPIRDTRFEIVITPKMSFGTGHHATTYMMIEQMSDIDFVHKDVFDFGTGTGILAILAEHMGATGIKATDIDEWSITNAKENAANNECKKINLDLTDVLPEGSFDIILANINRNIILSYLPDLRNHLKVNGTLLISGLLEIDEADIVMACNKKGLKLNKQLTKSGWISLLFVN